MGTKERAARLSRALWCLPAGISLVFLLLTLYAYFTTESEESAREFWINIQALAFIFAISCYGGYRNFGPIVFVPTVMGLLSASIDTGGDKASEMLVALCMGVVIGLLIDLRDGLGRRKESSHKKG